MTEAIGAGQMDLALSLAAKIPAAKLSTDARLLLVTDAGPAEHLACARRWVEPFARALPLSSRLL